MKYVTEIGLDAMICIPSSIKTDSGIQKIMWGRGFTDAQHGDRISLL
jgi:hypothetical protein